MAYIMPDEQSETFPRAFEALDQIGRAYLDNDQAWMEGFPALYALMGTITDPHEMITMLCYLGGFGQKMDQRRREKIGDLIIANHHHAPGTPWPY